MTEAVFVIDHYKLKDFNLLEQVSKHGYKFADLSYLTLAGNAYQYAEFLYENGFINFLQYEKIAASIQHYVREHVVKVEE
ncbi:MAG: hypothetical protein SPL03_10715 [Succinivibrio dextrinosolvens]|nr:hypothetical protein [Succinivibrio dextrinosolvens]